MILYFDFHQKKIDANDWFGLNGVGGGRGVMWNKKNFFTGECGKLETYCMFANDRPPPTLPLHTSFISC